MSERWGVGEAHAQAVLGVLRGTSLPGADPYLREWASVGAALRDADMSEDWLQLFFGHLETWYASARHPERGRREALEQYWRRRLDGTGAVPWLDLLEYVHRRELTPEQRNTEPVRNAYVFAAEDYVLAFNDPTSVERDARQQVPNLCTLVADERSITPAEAAAELARQHLLRVRRRQAEVKTARRTHPDLTWWLDRACVHHLGMARAHVPDRSRYGELQTVSGSSFHIRVITS
ncbi:terpene synthase family protein [Amycolatopsis sp. WAC 04197]|uniref:terpene synthase family protein n=1 Tax=Amycolatopsis sp. WAC 04197 TaxID=2203199 RepID=UPI000F766D27|nr:terpene synthase family protein [Amycolatopsis sp. WAC 04197]